MFFRKRLHFMGDDVCDVKVGHLNGVQMLSFIATGIRAVTVSATTQEWACLQVASFGELVAASSILSPFPGLRRWR